MAKFSEWLQEEMDRNRLSQADLSRKSGLSSATISRILNEERKPGPEACAAIANGLGVSQGEVFRAAGLLPVITEQEAMLEDLIFNYMQLGEEERKDLVYFSKVLRDRESYYRTLEKPEKPKNT